MAPRFGMRRIIPFFFEFEKSQPNVGTVRVELLAQILLDQPLTRVAPAEHDFFFQPRGNQFGNGRSARAALGRDFAQLSFRRCGCAARRRLLPQCPAYGHGQ